MHGNGIDQGPKRSFIYNPVLRRALILTEDKYRRGERTGEKEGQKYRGGGAASGVTLVMFSGAAAFLTRRTGVEMASAASATFTVPSLRRMYFFFPDDDGAGEVDGDGVTALVPVCDSPPVSNNCPKSALPKNQ